MVEERLEAVLYVNETLREFWPRVSPATRRRSLLRWLGRLVEQGQAEGVIAPGLSLEIAVATLVGTLGQITRQISFGERGKARKGLENQIFAVLHAALTRSTP